MKYVIYRAIINKKSYIGITKDLIKRKKWHIRDAKNKLKTQFHYAIKKYGQENIKWEILETCNSKELAYILEMELIKEYNTFKNGYNMTLGGEGCLDYEFTKEDKEKISKAQKLRFKSKSERLKCVNKKVCLFYVFTLNGQYVGQWDLQSECAKYLNLTQGKISQCLLKKSKTHKGYIFTYDKNEIDELIKNKKRHKYPTQRKFSVHKNNKLVGIWYSFAQCQRELGISGVYRYLNGQIKRNKQGYIFKWVKE